MEINVIELPLAAAYVFAAATNSAVSTARRAWFESQETREWLLFNSTTEEKAIKWAAPADIEDVLIAWLEETAPSPSKTTLWVSGVSYMLDPVTRKAIPDTSANAGVQIDPVQPPCPKTSDKKHVWQYGVQLRRGEAELQAVCKNCGLYYLVDTFAPHPETGDRGFTLIKYVSADADSLDWVERNRKQSEEL